MAASLDQRRLAAIVVADVVGYSRLMGADDTGTLAALKHRREMIMQPVVRSHGGRIVNLVGDSALLEFASAVNAVNAALELQRKFGEADDKLPEERRIKLRVGINLGDVIGYGADIYGDGVNIAARLEALAEPGGICISAKVHDEVRGKIAAGFTQLGAQQLKNIAKPVGVFRLHPSTAPETVSPLPERAPPDNPSIAVLPFFNMSSDPEQDYFSDGMTEDIITELSRFRSLRVTARNSSFRHRGKDLEMIRVGRELGVHYLVEGSVRRIGDRIRITAQLIDASTGNHVWAERFDRNQEDIFAVQDEVVRTIAATLVGRVEADSTERAKRKPPASMMAYDYVLRGLALPVGDSDIEAEARSFYEKAIELDPSYALPHALLSFTYINEWLRDDTGSAAALDRAFSLAKKAVANDENSADCCLILAWVYINQRAHDLAEQYTKRALELNPSNPHCYSGMAEWMTWMGRATEAIQWFDRVKLVDPHYNPTWWWRTLGLCYFVARRYGDATVAFNRSSVIPDWAHAYLAASFAYLHLPDDARRHAAEVLRLKPTFSISRFAVKEPFAHDADRQHLIEGLLMARLPA